MHQKITVKIWSWNGIWQGFTSFHACRENLI